MFTAMSHLFKKFVLAGLVLTLGLTALPATAAFAASGGTTSTPTPAATNPNQRLQELFADEKATNERQGDELGRSGPLISLAKQIIAAAKKHGLNTFNAEIALDRFKIAVLKARLIHEHAVGIIAAHPGFDAHGFVTDRVKAAETVSDLGMVLENFRDAYYPPFNALVEALRDLIQQFSPNQALTGLLS
ncbi:MAG: hypothetical protein ABSB41_03340 [Anaerolineales bacterium]|jgi:hypothetical protein